MRKSNESLTVLLVIAVVVWWLSCGVFFLDDDTDDSVGNSGSRGCLREEGLDVKKGMLISCACVFFFYSIFLKNSRLQMYNE